MKRLVILVGTIGVMALAQAPREPYPGRNEHKEPPKGWVCSNHPRTPAKHRCGCRRQCVKNPDGTLTEERDPQCTTWCWEKDHCACAGQCEQT